MGTQDTRGRDWNERERRPRRCAESGRFGNVTLVNVISAALGAVGTVVSLEVALTTVPRLDESFVARP